MEQAANRDRRICALAGLMMWLTYGYLSTIGDRLSAGLIGLAIAVAIVAAQYRRAAVKIMDCASVGYLVLETAIVLWAGSPLMQRFELPIVWGVFAIVAWITLLVGFPFTLQYEREQAPRDVWDSPGFYQMNVHLTLAWALVFTISTVLGAVAMVVGYGLMLGVIIPIGGMAFAFIFSKRYPNRFIAQFEVEGRRSGANRPAGAPIEAICDAVRTG